MLGRIVRAADFERVLRSPACARSAHFAVHFVNDRPSRPGGRMAPAAGRKDWAYTELSTDDEQACSQPVDDLPIPASPSFAAAALWLGTVVPKRHAKRSVTRTLLKRQMRAAMLRRCAADRPRSGLWVVRLRTGFDRAAFASAASDALRRAASTELDTVLLQAGRKLELAP
jgi:ribonuclease P protein component